MKDSKQIQADIDDLQASVAPALLEIKKLEQELSDALSREFEEIKIGVLRAKAPGRIEHVPVNFWHAARTQK